MSITAGITERIAGMAPADARMSVLAAAQRNPALRGPVLVATRGRADARSATELARALAARLDRKVEMVSVIEPILLYGVPPEVQISAVRIDEEARQSRQNELDAAGIEVLGRKDAFEVATRIGQPAVEICDAARELDATLILVGATPHRRLRRIVAGQRAAQVLQRASSPVVSVAPWLRDLPHNIVAAIDFSPASIRAAQAAMLLLADGGTMTLLHVLPPNYIFPLPGAPETTVQSRAMSQLEKVRDLLRSILPQGAKIELAIKEGDPGTEILDYSDLVNADLVALGTRGQSLLRRMFVGSVASEVFHSSLCSVLASPAPAAVDEMQIQLDMKGSAETADHKQFAELLDAFSRRNVGRWVALEEDDAEIGAQVQAHGYRLNGVTYDHGDRRVDIMLGPSIPGTVHLTRTIPGVTSVAVSSGEGGVDRALQIRHGDSQTLVLIQPARDG